MDVYQFIHHCLIPLDPDYQPVYNIYEFVLFTKNGDLRDYIPIFAQFLSIEFKIDAFIFTYSILYRSRNLGIKGSVNVKISHLIIKS